MGCKHVNSRGTEYLLHERETTLRNGIVRKLYFFAKDERDGHCDVPEGHMVFETKNGLPVIKRDRDYTPPETIPEEPAGAEVVQD